MASTRVTSWLSTVGLVFGALLVGDAIHGAIVTSQYSLVSPAAVFRFVPGVVCIWLGSRARGPIEYTPSDGTRDPPGSEPADDTGEYDPDLSPLGETPADDDRGDRHDRHDRRDRGPGDGRDGQ